MELVVFAKAVESGRNMNYVSEEISEAIAGVIEDFSGRRNKICIAFWMKKLNCFIILLI